MVRERGRKGREVEGKEGERRGEREREGEKAEGVQGGEGTEGERGEMERGGRERIKMGTDLQQLYKHSNQGGHIMYRCHLQNSLCFITSCNVIVL